ncbi:NSMAF [Balamuthia mandrillaris]
MFVERKNKKTRFSLLLLSEGEYYFDDFSATYYPGEDDARALKQKMSGRLKLCSCSLFFVPKEKRYPIMRLPFSHTRYIERWTGNLFSRLGFKEDIFVVRSSMVALMKENDTNAPYVFKHEEQDHKFSLSFESVSSFLQRATELFRISQLPPLEAERKLERIIEAKEASVSFDPSWLVNINEKPLLEIPGNRITPLASTPGRIMITNSRLYFQSLNNIDVDPVQKYAHNTVVQIHYRRHMLRHIGLEIFFDNDTSLFLSFKNKIQRDTVYDLLVAQPEMTKLHLDRQAISVYTQQWQNGQLSNYDYLVLLNSMAGRTINDLTQYPVMPWIVADYESEELDLNSPSTFRDLSKPVGALNPTRLQNFLARYEEMPEPKFLYGTHYSAPGFVLFYLVRKAPEFLLRLQNGKFDAPDRLFASIPETWHNVNVIPTDVKELIPEFYQPPGDFLLNSANLNLGCRSDGKLVGDVELPPWAKGSPRIFVEKLREALESDYVTENLHHWIDLIFGYKQRGEESVKANNVFYHLTYEGAVDIEKVRDPLERKSLEVQINEFGQTPKQLFTQPHPKAEKTRNASVTSRSSATTSTPATTPSMTPWILSDEAIPGLSGPFRALTSLDSDQTTTSESKPAPEDGSSLSIWNNLHCLSSTFSQRLHRDITAMNLSSKGDTLYSVSQDSTLKIFSLEEKRQVRSVQICDLALSSCSLPENENSIIVGSWDNNIYMYSIDYGRVIDSLLAHDDAVSCLGLHGEELLSGSWDASLKLWGILPSGISKTPTTEFLEFETEVKCLDVRDHLAVAGANDGSVMFLDLRMQRPIRTLQMHRDCVNALKLSPDGCRVVSCGADRYLKVTDQSSGHEILAVDMGESLRCVETNGDKIITGGEKGLLRVWEIATNAEVASYEPPSSPSPSFSSPFSSPFSSASSSSIFSSGSSSGGGSSITCLALPKDSPTSVVVAYSDANIRLWGCSSGSSS